MSSSEPRAIEITPVTALLGISSLAVTILWWSGGSIDPLTLDYRVWSEPWRAFTSVLPHVEILHLLFNLYWLFVFGGKIEKEFGPLKTTFLYLALGVGSSLAQFTFSGSGVGLSGIGYGLFGFLWVLSRSDSRFTGAITSRISQLFVLWFFFCIFLTLSDWLAIGNVAHGTGATLGAILGWCVVARTPQTHVASRWLFVGVLANLVIAAAFGRPYLNQTESVAEEYAYFGYLALENDKLHEAVGLLETVVWLKPDDSSAWYNLGVAYWGEHRRDAALEAFTRAVKLAPNNEQYRSTRDEIREYVESVRRSREEWRASAASNLRLLAP